MKVLFALLLAALLHVHCGSQTASTPGQPTILKRKLSGLYLMYDSVAAVKEIYWNGEVKAREIDYVISDENRTMDQTEKGKPSTRLFFDQDWMPDSLTYPGPYYSYTEVYYKFPFYNDFFRYIVKFTVVTHYKYEADLEKRTVTAFSNGKPADIFYFNKEGLLSRIDNGRGTEFSYLYNKQGHLITAWIVTKEEGKKLFFECSYTYDNRGNWIRQVRKDYNNPGLAPGIGITTREITYHNQPAPATSSH